MQSKKKRWAACRLYLILDTQVADYDVLLKILRQLKDVPQLDVVQLRDKNSRARDMLNFAKAVRRIIPSRTLFIVNDRVDVAKLSGADGVHVGQEDIPVREARRILGPNKTVGTSCQTLKHLQQASVDGADYVGFGSVFKTLTKPEREPMDLGLLTKAADISRREGMPLFAIGGISIQNISQVLDCGVQRVAICREVLLSRDVSSSVKELGRLLNAV